MIITTNCMAYMTDVDSPNSGESSPKSGCGQSCTSWGGSVRGGFLPLPASGVLWHSWASGCTLQSLPCLHMAFWSVFLPDLPLLSYKGASHRLECPLQHQDSLTWDTHLLPNKGTSTGARTETSLLGRHSLTYGRYGNSQRDHKLSHFNSRELWRQKSFQDGEKTEAVMNYFWKSNQFLRLNLPNSMLFLCGQKRETV